MLLISITLRIKEIILEASRRVTNLSTIYNSIVLSQEENKEFAVHSYLVLLRRS